MVEDQVLPRLVQNILTLQSRSNQRLGQPNRETLRLGTTKNRKSNISWHQEPQKTTKKQNIIPFQVKKRCIKRIQGRHSMISNFWQKLGAIYFTTHCNRVGCRLSKYTEDKKMTWSCWTALIEREAFFQNEWWNPSKFNSKFEQFDRSSLSIAFFRQFTTKFHSQWWISFHSIGKDFQHLHRTLQKFICF